jgi:dienelactone hydrolase
MTVNIPITESKIESNGIHGKLFRPSDYKRRPGIIILGGSGGGLEWSDSFALRLANEGYAALALAYFRYADLPKTPLNIPLEYFNKAFDWMSAREDIDTGKLVIIGGSRGAELALILGAAFPVIKAVIGYAASSVVWSATGGITLLGRVAWTHQNQPLPRMKMSFSPKLLWEIVKMIGCLIRKKSFHAVPLLTAALDNQSLVERSSIEVEKIGGPVVLISGDDDQLFPSTLMSEMIMERLEKHKHPYPNKHYRYEQAGHSINLPDLPPEHYPTQTTHVLTNLVCELGGNPEVNEQAGKKAWQNVVAFLEKHIAVKGVESDWIGEDLTRKN